MDIDIKRLYISTLDTANATTKFNNFDFLSFALKTPGIQNSLEKRLQDLGVRQGIMFIINHLFNYEYKVARTSIDNEEIKAYVSNRTKKFGIFSTKSLNWLEMNNIKYNDEYTLKSKIPQPYMDKDMTIYLVETYVKNGVEDDSSFYIVVPASSQNKMAKGHFISSQMWKKVLEELRPQETGQLNLDKEKYTDIKEIKKGR